MRENTSKYDSVIRNEEIQNTIINLPKYKCPWYRIRCTFKTTRVCEKCVISTISILTMATMAKSDSIGDGFKVRNFPLDARTAGHCKHDNNSRLKILSE